MNGRVFAVNRSPVIAWNIEPPQLQVPYPDMPAAAAAAISPIVPAASDPYGRCWQNQVDAGTSFPYFGALYNNSLPPNAYRLQPGCMPNLSQFWPPTPPPDGCGGRFDGSNLYFGPPVLRHAENISSNIRNSFQGLGHYSHLVEVPKEQNQRMFKRETPISPNVSVSGIPMCSSSSKSDNVNSCCVVDSKQKSQTSLAYSLPKQELHTVSSGHEPYLCAPDIRSSSSLHPSTEKSFSPSHSLKNSLNFHSSSQDNSLRAKSLTGNQENCNASPLKNVYFSHYESENVSSVHSKNFERHSERQLQFELKNSVSLSGNKSKHLHHQPSNNFQLAYPSKKYDFPGGHEVQNGMSNYGIPRSDNRTGDDIILLNEQYKQRSGSYKVKAEKNSNHSDCKFQKSVSKNSVLVQGPEYKSTDKFNIPTSVLHPKIEPSDKYFLSSCSSTAPSSMATSYATSSPYLMAKDLSADLRTGYQNSIYQNSCSLSKPWHYNELPAINLDTYFKSPEAAKPPSKNPPHVSFSSHEGLISVAQTAPQDMDVLRVSGPVRTNVQPPSSLPKKNCRALEIDDEVQIIGIQTKRSSPVKQEARYASETSKLSETSTYPVSVPKPLFLKKEKEPEVEEPSPRITNQKIAKTVSPPLCETIVLEDERKMPVLDMKPNLETLNPVLDGNNSKLCETVTIKQELINENVEESSCVESIKSEVEEVCENSETLNSSNNYSSSNCDLKNNSSSNEEKVGLTEDVCMDVQEMDENHGLNLLLNTIEKVTSFEKKEIFPPILQGTSFKEENPPLDDAADSIHRISSVHGLDLLSAIAGQRLVSEFDPVKLEVKEESLSCNYPEVKEGKIMSDDDQVKQQSEASINNPKTSVFEIQSKMAELKKKYKQKQRELHRLKPKRRFASSYLRGHHKAVSEDRDKSLLSSTTSSTMSDSLNSSMSDHHAMEDENEATIRSKSKCDIKDELLVNKEKRSTRLSSIKKEPSEETCSDYSFKRITRRSFRKSKINTDVFNLSKESKIIKRNSKSKTSNLKNQELALNLLSDVLQSSSSKSSTLMKAASKKLNSLPDNTKANKVYALRHSSQHLSKQMEVTLDDSALSSKAISSKRKSVNPQKYIPSKQSKLSETIVAKHLRSRILFDTSGSMSDDEKNVKDGVPNDLYDALRKCHLSEEGKSGKVMKDISTSKLSRQALSHPKPSRLCPEHLVEKQRLLALEDGLFYAGCIKENQMGRKYGIALDGQRGNRLHMFTPEELFTQTIVESKPLTSELPEGTRVCAYWSQQYRCLYPGVVGKAPCPSADWSEPRVFVLFDDGDSGQIPTKNIRLIPSDIIPVENTCRTDSCSSALTKTFEGKSKSSGRGQSKKRLRSSTPKNTNTKHLDTTNENESKESSCASINESSCDDSCFIDYSLSPSHTPDDHNNVENTISYPTYNSADNAKSAKRQRKRSKRRTSCRAAKLEQNGSVEPKEKSEAKTKRHKKYKDKHRRHHHHHHRHHHHHHHHHHSKKRKHRRKNARNTPPQDLNYENCIPCNSNLKSQKDFQATEGACSDLIEHSSIVNLPQSD